MAVLLAEMSVEKRAGEKVDLLVVRWVDEMATMLAWHTAVRKVLWLVGL